MSDKLISVDVTFVGSNNNITFQYFDANLRFGRSSVHVVQEFFGKNLTRNIIPYRNIKCKILKRGRWSKKVEFQLVAKNLRDNVKVKMEFKVNQDLKTYATIDWVLGRFNDLIKEYREKTQPKNLSRIQMLQNRCLAVFGVTSKERSASLPDLPTELLQKITEQLDTRNRMTIRKVCRTLRDVIDYQGSGVKSVKVGKDFLIIDGKCIKYRESVRESCMVIYEEREKAMVYGTIQQLMFNDLAILLKSPNVQLSQLDLAPPLPTVCHKTNVNFVVDVFKSVKDLHLDKVHFKGINYEEIDTILRQIKAGVLKEISFDYKINNSKIIPPIGDMVYSEQWKKAEHLFIQTHISLGSLLDHISHFHTIDILCHTFSRLQILQLKKIIDTSKTIRKCVFRGPITLFGLAKVFDPKYKNKTHGKMSYVSKIGKSFLIEFTPQFFRITEIVKI